MRFLVMLEQTETGFAVQAPDLAIATYGENIEAVKRAAFRTTLRIPNFGTCCSRMST